MKSKHIIIIVAAIVVIAVIGAYFLLNDNQEITSSQVPMRLSKSAYMEIPDNPDATLNTDKKGVSHYTDEKDDINITVASNLSLSSSKKEMKKLKDSVATGSKKTKEDNVVIYEKNGTYSVFVKNTQYDDTVLIQSSNKNLLLQCFNSIKFHSPTDSLKFNDTGKGSGGSGSSSSKVVDIAQQTQSTVKKTTSSSSSSSSSKSSSSSSSGYGDSYSDFVSSSSSSKSSKSSKSSSYGDSYSDFV